MTKFTRDRRPSGDHGVSLVLALVFVVLVGLFATVALNKSGSTLVAGQQLRDRGLVQYTIDGGVERGLQVLSDDMQNADPSTCAQPADPTTSGSLTLNSGSSSASWACTLLAGRAKKSSDVASTDYGLVVTSPNPGALTTQSGASDDVAIGGSVYANGVVSNSDLKKKISLTVGDFVSPISRAGCEVAIDALTDLTVATGYLKTCTEQTVEQAQPTVNLPAAPALDMSLLFGSGVAVTTGGGGPGGGPGRGPGGGPGGGGGGGGGGSTKTCQVFYPGKYTSPPDLLNGANYFVSGLYYFAAIGTWTFTGNNLTVSGGARTVGTDSARLEDDCSDMNMTDATALSQPAIASILATIQSSTFSGGTTWVLGGSTRLDMRQGSISLFTPPMGSSSKPVNVVALPAASGGYAAFGTSTGTSTAINGMSNDTQARFNAKIYTPTARVDVFSTQKTEAVARAGIVAREIDLQASVAGGGGLAISARSGAGTPPPPYRTVKVVSSDTAFGTIATNTAVATISNYFPYTVTTKSWRTQD